MKMFDLWLAFVVLLSGATALCVTACRDDPERSPSPLDIQRIDRALQDLELTTGSPSDAERPDVVIIVLDTVRRDRTSVYTDGDTTPNLAAWAADARVFTNARSVASWTLPAHASLFTGKYPISHGAHSGAPDTGMDFYALPEGTPTLAGALSREGYATVGIVANRGFLNEATGLHQGFDAWLCDGLWSSETSPPYPNARRITDMAVRVLEAPRSRPVFLFLNYIDAHTPMTVRKSYLSPGVKIRQQWLPQRSTWKGRAHALMARGEAPPEGFFDTWNETYDAEIRYLDEHLGYLLRSLPRLGITDDDLVFILSDHGEGFGEHDLVSHWRSVYEELISIPLIARGPGFDPGSDDGPVQIQDIPRWILDRAGIDRLPDMTETGDMQVAELYWTRQYELRIPSLRPRFDRIVRAFVRDGHKLILGDDGEMSLYDLTSDPLELSPQSDPDGRADLDKHAARWLSSKRAMTGEPREASENMREALRALGYIEEE